MIPLGLLSPGENGEIQAIRINKKAVSGHGSLETGNHDCRVEDMGLRVGKIVEMLTNCGGPVLVRGDESRIAIDRGLAMKIMIRR